MLGKKWMAPPLALFKLPRSVREVFVPFGTFIVTLPPARDNAFHERELMSQYPSIVVVLFVTIFAVPFWGGRVPPQFVATLQFPPLMVWENAGIPARIKAVTNMQIFFMFFEIASRFSPSVLQWNTKGEGDSTWSDCAI
jgi:hypothetical protein